MCNIAIIKSSRRQIFIIIKAYNFKSAFEANAAALIKLIGMQRMMPLANPKFTIVESPTPIKQIHHCQYARNTIPDF